MEKAGKISHREAKQLISAKNGLNLEDVIDFLSGFTGVINPEHLDFSLLYPSAGYDVFTPLLIADPTLIVMIEGKDMGLLRGEQDVTELHQEAREFLKREFPRGWATDAQTNNIYLKMITELYLLGIKPGNVEFKEEDNAQILNLMFSWKHPLGKRNKVYKISLSNRICRTLIEDIDEYGSYFPSGGFDVLLSKADASMLGQRILEKSDYIKDGGIVVADRGLTGGWAHPGRYRKIDLDENVVSKGALIGERGYCFGYTEQSNCPDIYRIIPDQSTGVIKAALRQTNPESLL
ncbi:MAG: hypothetical protein U9O94_03100 [Nanoarchaeota archaeon]|nr:hypothetical protein [Nanoarchaeota archaeon]